MYVNKNCVFQLYILLQVRIILCKIESKIVGGHYTTINAFPHAVFLSARGSNSKGLLIHYFCGASILSQRVLLTAAHCLVECKVKRNQNHFITAYAGHEDYRKSTLIRNVSDYVVHGGYNSRSVANDIGLALLTKSIRLDKTTKRILISKKYLNPKDALTAGWGQYDLEIFEHSNVLKSVWQKLRSPEVCSLVGKLEYGMLCAGSKNVHADQPASGDSGSGLIYRGIYAIGIISFKIPKFPALLVYTNITYYYNWIKSNSKYLVCKSK